MLTEKYHLILLELNHIILFILIIPMRISKNGKQGGEIVGVNYVAVLLFLFFDGYKRL